MIIEVLKVNLPFIYVSGLYQKTDRQGPITLQRILFEVCHVMNVSADEVKSDTRKNDAVIARRIYIYISRQITSSAFKEISAMVNRDHSTGIYTYNKMVDWMGIKSYAAEFEPILKQVKDGLQYNG